MLTSIQLRERLSVANVEKVAELAGVSTKTIYRIRTDPDYSPRLAMAEALSKALLKLERLQKSEAGSAA